MDCQYKEMMLNTKSCIILLLPTAQDTCCHHKVIDSKDARLMLPETSSQNSERVIPSKHSFGVHADKNDSVNIESRERPYHLNPEKFYSSGLGKQFSLFE